MLKKIGSILLVVVLALSCNNSKNFYEKSTFDLEPSNTIENISTISELSTHVVQKKLKNVEIKKAILNYPLQDFTLDFEINNVVFNKCQIRNLSVSKNLSNVIFKNCSFENIQVRNSNFNSVRFDNCRISDLTISSTVLKHFQINNSALPTKILITNCKDCYDVKLKGVYDEIETRGGKISFLDVAMIDTFATLKIDGTQLSFPSFQNHVSTNVEIVKNLTIYAQSFSNLNNFGLKEQLLFEEIDTDNSYETARNEIKERFLSVEATYNKLSSKFNESNDKKYANYFKFKEHQFHSKLNQSELSQKFSVIWHEFIRGNYGTSVIPIAIAFITVWFAFGFLYFMLAFLNIAVISYKYSVNGQDKTYIVSIGAKFSNILNAISNCYYFSITEMFSGGITSNIKLGNFSNNYQSPPRTYIAIGVGRIISFIQNVLGIILIFRN